MRVALAHPHSWPEVRRGGERVLHDLAWALTKSGHSVEIVTGTRGASTTDLVEEVPVHRLRHHDALDRRGLERYETFGLEAFPWLARHRFDVVVAMTPTSAIASRAAGQRTVFATMGWPTPEYWDYRPVEGRLFPLAARMANARTVLSTAAADSVEQLTGIRPVVLGPGIRLEVFPPTLGARRGRPVVLFASWAEEPGKGLDLLFEAFLVVLDGRPDACLWLAGGGDPRWALEGLALDARHRLEGAVEFVGSPDVAISPNVYGEAHVTVLPSRTESFGLVLLESLACGTPVVGSARGGILDVADGCRAARLVPHGDVKALARAIEEGLRLAADPRTAEDARAHAETFDWAGRVGARHAEFYEKVSQKRRSYRPHAVVASSRSSSDWASGSSSDWASG